MGLGMMMNVATVGTCPIHVVFLGNRLDSSCVTAATLLFTAL
jgi:hypothetical protein